MENLKLTRPVMIDGAAFTNLEYDFDNLEATAVEQAIKSLKRSQHIIMAQETDPLLHAAIFAQAAGIDLTDMQRLSAKDYLEAGRRVRDFSSSVWRMGRRRVRKNSHRPDHHAHCHRLRRVQGHEADGVHAVLRRAGGRSGAHEQGKGGVALGKDN